MTTDGGGMERGGIGFVVGLAAEARVLRGLGVAVAVGGGMPVGAGAAAARLVAGGAVALVSFGLAGGLDPALPAGSLLVPRQVFENGAIYACDAGLAAWLGGFAGGAVLAGAEMAVTPGEKARLFAQTGAAAVDLESGAVARVAAAHGLPFAVLRAVADPANRELPPAATLALNGAGKIAVLAVLRSVVRRPGQVPALLALARDAAGARRALVARLRLMSSRVDSAAFLKKSSKKPF